ncbi:MAG: hypothetical protein LBI05_01730 [Planctomycetaceae bacterium]|jgi:hypothetical protein|nr:hypothetical protein [Planctomycetaceae bacterium]
MFPKISVVLVLFSLTVFSVGCQTRNATPTNPFAQNLKTVPPPGTFSSQESYLGQTPGTFVPQTPATTYPSSGTSATVPVSDLTNSQEKATLFAATENNPDWTPVAAATSQTAFQAMEAKVGAATSSSGLATESLVVGTSYAVTTITDESQSDTTIAEPPLLLYSGN